MCRILLLSGMTPDPRTFARLLTLVPTAQVVDWIQPNQNESIPAYASRLGLTLGNEQPTIVCGLSFGGIVAQELANCLNASACLLVSTIRTPTELPPWFRILRSFRPTILMALTQAVGNLAMGWPRSFKTAATWRLSKLGGESGAWHRWATTAVLAWQPSPEIGRIPIVQIHGDRDQTFPLRYHKSCYVKEVIPGGGHNLTLTHSQEIANRLRALSNVPSIPRISNDRA